MYLQFELCAFRKGLLTTFRILFHLVPYTEKVKSTQRLFFLDNALNYAENGTVSWPLFSETFSS